MRALIVDDDPVAAGHVRALLAAQGWKAEAVGDATSARRVLARGGIDLLLVDFVLPDADGVELIRTVRGDGHAIPVLALTGADSESVIEGLLRAGAHDVLDKSRIDGATLRAAIGFARGPQPIASGEPAPRAPAADEAPRIVAPAPGRALVVDDVASARKRARLLLERDGWTVEEAATAEEGLRLAAEKDYDVLLIDYLLPDVDGAGLLHELRRRGVETPVVVVSAHGGEELAMEFVLAGAAEFVPKEGLSRGRLQDALARALATARWTRRAHR